MTNTPSQSPSNNPILRTMTGEKPTTSANGSPEQHMENVLSRAIKGDTDAIKNFIDNPMEALKNGFIEIIKKLFGSIGSQLSDLQNEVENGGK